MAKQKLSMSEKIRRQLAQGKSVKEISKSLKCSAGLVYAVRSSDKKNEAKAENRKAWEAAGVSTSKKPLRVEGLSLKQPQPISLPADFTIPKDYYQPKPTLFQRVKNFFMGV